MYLLLSSATLTHTNTHAHEKSREHPILNPLYTLGHCGTMWSIKCTFYEWIYPIHTHWASIFVRRFPVTMAYALLVLSIEILAPPRSRSWAQTDDSRSKLSMQKVKWRSIRWAAPQKQQIGSRKCFNESCKPTIDTKNKHYHSFTRWTWGKKEKLLVFVVRVCVCMYVWVKSVKNALWNNKNDGKI